MLKRTRRQAGDTLIEVLFAVTVLSLVIVSAMSIMNQGSAAAQRSIEITVVTQQIDNQAEALRFLHEAYVTNYQAGYAANTGLSIPGATGNYYDIVQRVKTANLAQASPFNRPTSCPTSAPAGSFIINPRTGASREVSGVYKLADTYSQLTFNAAGTIESSEGLWIEGVRSSGTIANTGYIDFHIRACWNTPGTTVPLTLGTIVRLYEPRS